MRTVGQQKAAECECDRAEPTRAHAEPLTSQQSVHAEQRERIVDPQSGGVRKLRLGEGEKPRGWIEDPRLRVCQQRTIEPDPGVEPWRLAAADQFREPGADREVIEN